MDDHFWPSLYPGIIVGVLYGISAGGWRGITLGGVGGLIGATLAYFAVRWLAVPEGFVTLAASVIVAIAGAFAMITLGRRFLPQSS